MVYPVVTAQSAPVCDPTSQLSAHGVRRQEKARVWVLCFLILCKTRGQHSCLMTYLELSPDHTLVSSTASYNPIGRLANVF